MALSDNRRLYDIATRLAIYTEGVKIQNAREFSFVLLETSRNLSKFLGNVRFKTLDGLTKAQLNRLLIDLRKAQAKIYAQYTDKLIKQLEDFMRADLEVSRRAFVTGYIELDNEESDDIISDEQAIQFLINNPQSDANPLFGLAGITGDDSRIWSQITTQPIPGNGAYLLPFIKTFSTSAQASIESIIRKAWANRLTVEETLQQLVGDGSTRQGTSSQLERINVQAKAVIHTSYAHVAAITTAAVSSALFGRYGWYSVMDGKTTEICISRNRKIYRYGEGPLPPGHIRCRSHIAPVVGTADIPEETFYTWVMSQPAAIQDDMLSEEGSELLRSGKLKAKDIVKYDSEEPLTLEQFRKKIKEILTR